MIPARTFVSEVGAALVAATSMAAYVGCMHSMHMHSTASACSDLVSALQLVLNVRLCTFTLCTLDRTGTCTMLYMLPWCTLST
jgi:hypothetical protein